MVDIETLGTDPGAVILSVGAVTWDIDPNGEAVLGDEFHTSIDSDSAERAGLETDPETVEWWEGQPDTAREILDGGRVLPRGLLDFAEFVESRGGFAEVWANSPRFDCCLLEVAYDRVGMDLPWRFFEEADVRTLKKLPQWPDLDREGTHHDALDDARYQARCVAETLRRCRVARREVSE
jgi:hypothetical protein